MNLTVLIALFIRVFSNPIANVIQKNLTKSDFDSRKINLHTYFILALIAIALLFYQPIDNISSEFLTYAILTGILGALGNWLLLKALEIGELSVLGPINSYKAVIAMVIGVVLLREIPEYEKLTGVVLIIVGSYFVIDRNGEKFSLKLLSRPDIKYRVWAMILTATEAVFLKKLLLLSNVHLTFAAWAIMGAFFSFLIVSLDKKNIFPKAINTVYWYKIGLISLGIVGMQYSTIYIFQQMNVAYALAIFQLSTLLTVFLGYYYFDEKNLLQKLLGSAIMIIGTLIILLL